AAAFLGAGADDQGALRARARADVAGRSRRPGDGPADRRLLGGAGRGDARAGGVRRLRARLRGRRARAGRAAPVVVGRTLPRPEPAARGVALPLLAALPRASLRRDGDRRRRLAVAEDRRSRTRESVRPAVLAVPARRAGGARGQAAGSKALKA